MSKFIKESQHLTIPFRDIEAATKNFSTCIGKGGYGSVYKGELLLSDGLTPVAVKRLDGNISGQGFKEFLTEIQLLSRYKHPNLVSLLGFCQEGHEKILIYEYAEHGSLDMYIDMAKTTFPLTWKKRISICVDAARGLDHLHNHVAEKHRVIHRDIKSANILLDHNWKAMIADLGLSKIGRANENDTYLITNACGTYGYCDPEYFHTAVLTKESDVFSFGVVLFEVLCGRLCFMNVNDERGFLVPLARSHYEKGKLHEIIDPELRKQMNTNSLYTFSAIAYQCLHKDREKRPSMDLVVEKLEEALLFQEIDESKHNSSIDLEEINKMSDSPMAYTTKDELYSHLSKGVLVNEGSVWVSEDDNGETHEMLSAIKFTYLDGRNFTAISAPESRFPLVVKILDASKLNIEAKIRTQFLSPGITYAAYLVFKYSESWSWPAGLPAPVNLKYTLKETSEMLFSYLADWRDNEWLMVELFQIINLQKNADFEVTLEGLLDTLKSGVLVEGIEFLPIKKLGDEETEKPEVGSLPLSEIDLENLLPSDYKLLIYYSTEEMMNMPYEEVVFPTKEEAYSLLCRGCHIFGTWFWLNISNGKKCFMVGAESLVKDISGRYYTLRASHGNESRFEKIVDLKGELKPNCCRFCFSFEIDGILLSPKTIYACYLVYKLPNAFHEFEYPVASRIQIGSHTEDQFLHLVRPRSPVIGPKSEWRNQTTVNRPKLKGLPNRRKDDWWEVSLAEFVYDNEISDADLILSKTGTTKAKWGVMLSSACGEMMCLTVQGIEFRPI